MSDALKLENQLCLPLYICSKEIVRRYKPILATLGLTYTQYIVMLTLWEYGDSNISRIGEKLYLDSGTLTPVLKKLEQKGLVKRKEDQADVRNLVITLTRKGQKLKDKAETIPSQIGKCVNISTEEYQKLLQITNKIINNIHNLD